MLEDDSGAFSLESKFLRKKAEKKQVNSESDLTKDLIEGLI